ncbi:hypothetical protein [Vallitalea guaymasensis]|uniref:hypothetical protein n=1 Tax=Vallitalea guaymasensis TaxID=1185412 RepID=UPI000DE34A82|nr:hypothetical protein [Vallitalea guaymasensis]
MAVKNINKEKSELIVIATAELYGAVEDQDSFKYDSNTSNTKIPGGIGYSGTKYVTTKYEGVDGTIDCTGAKDGKETLLAYAQHVNLDNYVGFHLSNAKELYFVARGVDDNDNLVTSYFIERAIITSEPVQLEEGNISFAFSAPQAMEFSKDIKIDAFEGASTPKTTLTLTNTAIADPAGRNIMLVLKDTPSKKGVNLKLGKDYTASTTEITLTEGLATGEKVLAVYLSN